MNKCTSRNPHATGEDIGGCELEANHYGVHSVTTNDSGAIVWFRNWIHPNVSEDTYRIPISEKNTEPDRNASMNEMLDARVESFGSESA